MIRRQKRQRITRTIWLSIGVSSPALADGLGGLSAMSFLFFVFTSIIPLSLMIIALLLTSAREKPAAAAPNRKRRLLATISATLGAIYVWWGMTTVGHPFPASLNPWLNDDTAVTSAICITLIVGNLIVFCSSWKSRGFWVGAAVAFVAVQWTLTPGKTIYYEHDPVDVDTDEVRVFNENFVEWDNHLIYSDDEIPSRFLVRPIEPIQAIVDREENGRFSVVTVEPNRDPRMKSLSSRRSNSQTRFRFPIQPSHRLATIVSAGQLMPEDWRAESDLLVSAASHRRSGDWIRFLVEHGANVNHVDEDNISPLSMAMKRGDPVTARLLAQLGADPNVSLDRGNRILHFAAREADYDDTWLLELLMQFGADPSLENEHGQSVSAVFYSHLDTGGKTIARQRMIVETWSLVLDEDLSDALLEELNQNGNTR